MSQLNFFIKCFFNANNTAQLARLTVLFLLLFQTGIVFSQDKEQTVDQAKEEVSIDVPQLSEIIPKAAELEDRHLQVAEDVNQLVDVEYIKTEYKKVEEYLKTFKTRFDKLKDEENVGSNELKYLKEELSQEKQIFNEINKPLTDAIEQLEKSRLVWISEKDIWNKWEKILLKEDLPSQAKISFRNAKKTIDKALNIISSRLNTLLKLQGSGYKNQSMINDYTSKISKLHQKKIVSSFEKASIPMYSPKFYEQFDNKLMDKVERGVMTVVYPSSKFFQTYWWAIILQLIIMFLVIVLIKKNRDYLLNHKDYKILADRAVSSGIFFSIIFVFMVFLDANSPQSWTLFLTSIGGLAFCRLFSNYEGQTWKKHFIYSIVAILIFTGICDVISLPILFFRIYILVFSALGIYKMNEWKKNNKETENKIKYTWFFNLASIYLVVVVLSEVFGKDVLALLMYESLLKTTVVIIFILVFMKMIHAGVEGGFSQLSKSILRGSPELIASTVKRFSFIINALIVFLALLPRLFVIWGVFDSIPNAIEGIFASGFAIGKVHVSFGLIISAISVLYGAFLLSKIVEMFLMSDTLEKERLDKGTRLSIAQLIRYFLLFVGFLLAIAVLGFDLTNFTIVLSALGVGIGFGLQGVVNNFVSGLILLFERPVREGDTIELQGDWSEIKKIGLRATRVMTFDQSDVIIPNSELVYNQVTNWTLSNRRRRIKVPVGVAYGSDVQMVMQSLIEVAKLNTDLFKSFEPVVLFRNFGDSTLNFELRVLAKDALNSIKVESDLIIAIDEKFRENNIEIAFPQRDLHIRSVDNSIVLKNPIDKQ